jgi:RNA polymerase sigma factor (sigma-70 family)
MTSRRLLERAGEGDGEAFAALVRAHRPGLLRATRARVGPGAAEDVVQEALLRAFVALRAGTRPPNLGAWLHVIARNAAVDAHRRGGGRQLIALHDGVAEAGAGPDDAAAARDDLRAIVAAVNALPDRQRAALLDVVLAGASYEEIARRQDTTVSAVKALVNRARVGVRHATGSLGVALPWRWWSEGLMPKLAAGAAIGVAGVLTLPPLTLPPVHSVPPAIAEGLVRSPHAPAAAVRLPRSQTRAPLVAGAHTVDAPPANVVWACANARSLRRFTREALLRAGRDLPADVVEYTDCAARIQNAARF